jgi:hypothetical protein
MIRKCILPVFKLAADTHGKSTAEVGLAIIGLVTSVMGFEEAERVRREKRRAQKYAE